VSNILGCNCVVQVLTVAPIKIGMACTIGNVVESDNSYSYANELAYRERTITPT
jgi:hypothetical protein